MDHIPSPVVPGDNQQQEKAQTSSSSSSSQREGLRERAGEREREREREICRLPFLISQLTWEKIKRGEIIRRKSAWREEEKSISLDIERSGACGYWLFSFSSAS